TPTTVSAASTSSSRAGAAASALPRARRSAVWRGNSPRTGISLISVGRTPSGLTPACASRSSRRGLAEARISRNGTGAPRPADGPLEAIVDTSLGQVVGRHLHLDLVAGQHADAVLAHLAGSMGNDDMAVLELHPESRVGKQLGHDTGKFKKLFLGHVCSETIAKARTMPWHEIGRA